MTIEEFDPVGGNAPPPADTSVVGDTHGSTWATLIDRDRPAGPTIGGPVNRSIGTVGMPTTIVVVVDALGGSVGIGGAVVVVEALGGSVGIGGVVVVVVSTRIGSVVVVDAGVATLVVGIVVATVSTVVVEEHCTGGAHGSIVVLVPAVDVVDVVDVEEVGDVVVDDDDEVAIDGGVVVVVAQSGGGVVVDVVASPGSVVVVVGAAATPVPVRVMWYNSPSTSSMAPAVYVPLDSGLK